MQASAEPPMPDRRQYDRLPVTMAARVRCDGRDYAGRILNLSEGGFLVALPEDFTPSVGLSVEVETAQLGTIPAQVVAVSAQGLHLRVSRASDAHGRAIQRLAGLLRPWIDGMRFRSWSEA